MQLGKYLIDTGKKCMEDFTFNDTGELISFDIGKELFDKNVPKSDGARSRTRITVLINPSPRSASRAKIIQTAPSAIFLFTSFIRRRNIPVYQVSSELARRRDTEYLGTKQQI